MGGASGAGDDVFGFTASAATMDAGKEVDCWTLAPLTCGGGAKTHLADSSSYVGYCG
jgi:hypothetical protein